MNKELLLQLTKIIEEQNSKQTKKITNELHKEITEVRQLLVEEKEKVKSLQKEVEELKLKNTFLDKQHRRNNIIVFNSGFVQGDLLNYTITLLNKNLQLDISERDISDIYRTGREQEDKPIIIKFVSFLTKQKVLKNCNKLKGTSLNISEELSQNERIIRRVLVKHLKIEKAKNKKAHIYKETLFVEGEAFTYNDLIRKQEETSNTENLSEPENPKITETTTEERTSNKGKTYQENIQESSTKTNFGDSHNIRSSARLNNKNFTNRLQNQLTSQ